MKGLGYRQVAEFLAGGYDYMEAVRRLKRDTRHFAKRQLTWFRHEPAIVWVTVDDLERPASVADTLLGLIESFLAELRGRPAQAAIAARIETRKVTAG